MLMSDGTFTAKEVELKQPEGVNENQLDGQVVAIDSSTEFKMVLHDEALDDDGVEIGNILTVTLQEGAAFQIDSDGIALPTTVTFLSAADLLVGQNLQIRIPSGSSGTAVTTDQLTLERSQITGKVTSPGGIIFTVGSLPAYFTNASPTITQIDVQTSSGTQFEDVTDAAGLNVGDTVSVRGLLFKTSANPLLAADSIYKRHPED